MSSTSKDAVTLRAKRSKKPSDGKMRRNVEIFVLSAPAILLFVCFVILPIVLGAYYGFYQWKGYGLPSKTGKFVGLQNYITALKDPRVPGGDSAYLRGRDRLVGYPGSARHPVRIAAEPEVQGAWSYPHPHLRAVCRFRGHRRHRMEPVATEEGRHQ